MLRIYPNLNLFDAVATINDGHVHCANYLFHQLQFKTGLKRRGKKADAIIKTEYIDEALSDFSGYVAADELYDGPFWVLFIVDNHKFRRLYYEVLVHNPTNENITRFFRRFKRMLDGSDLTLKGITTDGSPLYPEPITRYLARSSISHANFILSRRSPRIYSKRLHRSAGN